MNICKSYQKADFSIFWLYAFKILEVIVVVAVLHLANAPDWAFLLALLLLFKSY